MPSPLVVAGSLFGAFLVLAGASVLYRQQRRLWTHESTTGRVVTTGVEPRTTAWTDGSRWSLTEVVRSDDGSDATGAGPGGVAEDGAAAGRRTDAVAGRAQDDLPEYEYRDGDGAPGVDPVVEYEYRAGAGEYRNDTIWPAGLEPTRERLRDGNRGFAEAVVERFREGDQVTVYYDPDDPTDAFLVRRRNWMLPAICFAFVALLALWAGHCTGFVYVPVGEFNC